MWGLGTTSGVPGGQKRSLYVSGAPSQNRYSTRSPTPVKTCPIFFMRMSKIRHFDAILTPSWRVSPTLLTFRRHLPVTKADVLLTFCTYKVLYAKKKTAVKTTGGTCQVAYWWRRWDARGDMREATCARRHARGDMREDTNIKGTDTESDFWLIIYSVAPCSLLFFLFM